MLGKKSLHPGESTEIEAQLDPKGMRGEVQKSIVVISDDPKTPLVNLTMSAQVFEEVSSSTDLIHFSRMPRSAVLSKTVRYSSGNAEPLQPMELTISVPRYLSFSMRPEGKDQLLEVTISGPKIPIHLYRGSEQITAKFHGPRPIQLPLTISWDLEPIVTASPNQLVFQGLPRTALSQDFVLARADGKRFKVISAHSSLAGLQVVGLNQTATTQKLVVILPDTFEAGRYLETLSLITDIPEQQEVSIRVIALLK